MKDYWITNSRFRIILITLVLMWIGIMVLFYLKADEVTKDPCSICAERMGDKVFCSISYGNGMKSLTYYPDHSIEYNSPNKNPVLP